MFVCVYDEAAERTTSQPSTRDVIVNMCVSSRKAQTLRPVHVWGCEPQTTTPGWFANYTKRLGRRRVFPLRTVSMGCFGALSGCTRPYTPLWHSGWGFVCARLDVVSVCLSVCSGAHQARACRVRLGWPPTHSGMCVAGPATATVAAASPSSASARRIVSVGGDVVVGVAFGTVGRRR